MESHHHHDHHDPAPDWSAPADAFPAPAAPTDWSATPDAPAGPAGWSTTSDAPAAPTDWSTPPDEYPPSQWLPVGSLPTPATTPGPAQWTFAGPAVSGRRGTAALLFGIGAVLVGFCDFGILAVVAIVLGATHRRRVPPGGPGRRQALAGLLLGAIVVLPSLVLSIGFFLPQPG